MHLRNRLVHGVVEDAGSLNPSYRVRIHELHLHQEDEITQNDTRKTWEHQAGVHGNLAGSQLDEDVNVSVVLREPPELWQRRPAPSSHSSVPELEREVDREQFQM